MKFKKYYISNGQTKHNEVKARVSYNLDNRIDGRKCVTIYAKDYGHTLGYLFQDDYKNDTDMQSDYFDKGRVTLFEDHPHYREARQAVESYRK